jgi:hypothetical protein
VKGVGEYGQQGSGHRSRHLLRSVLRRTCRIRQPRKWKELSRRPDSQHVERSRGASLWRRSICSSGCGGTDCDDLGGSSDDSDENTEDRGGDGFLWAGDRQRVSRGLSEPLGERKGSSGKVLRRVCERRRGLCRLGRSGRGETPSPLSQGCGLLRGEAGLGRPERATMKSGAGEDTPVPKPQQVSKVQSLWLADECR